MPRVSDGGVGARFHLPGVYEQMLVGAIPVTHGAGTQLCQLAGD